MFFSHQKNPILCFENFESNQAPMFVYKRELITTLFHEWAWKQLEIAIFGVNGPNISKILHQQSHTLVSYNYAKLLK